MTSRQMGASEAALVPLFLGKESCNTTFVLDCSESTRVVLGSVKRLLIQTLLTKASRRDSLFNIMTFSNTVNAWSRHMLPCAPDTVYTALSWIHSIRCCGAGRDLLAALSLALSDPACHAVHLLAADRPEQPGAVLSALPALAAGRPVNTFYLQDSEGRPDISTRDYLRRLTQATGGSCCVVVDCLNGELGKASPPCAAEGQTSVPVVPPVEHRCPSSSLVFPRPHSTSSPPLRCSLYNPPVRPVTSCLPSGRTLGGSEFPPGCRVLARREMDGLYYSGTVTQQVQGRTGVYVVEFDPPGGAGSGVASSQRQLVCSPDMSHHVRHQAHRLVPGDTVLSPWQPNLRRYGPGRVTAIAERGGCCGAHGVTSVRVRMWNGCVSLVPDRLLSPLSASHHDRMVRELPDPTSASHSRHCSWLCARGSSWTPQLFCFDCPASTPHRLSVTNRRPCAVPPGCGPSLGGVDGSERAQQDGQVDFGNSDLKVPFSSSSSSSSTFTEDECTATFPPAGKTRSKQPHRPPWRYWRRTGPEPQHRQPGSAVTRTTTQPARFSFPVPQISASPNHSSLFQSLPGVKGGGASLREVLGRTNLRPRPPAGRQPLARSDVSAVYA